MSEEQSESSTAPISQTEECDYSGEEIRKQERPVDGDEHAPIVTATILASESSLPIIVNDAEPVHELAVAQILSDDDHASATGSITTISTTLSQPSTGWRSSYRTERTSSLTNYTVSEVLSSQETFPVEPEIVQIDDADFTDVPFDQSRTRDQHDEDEDETRFKRLHLYCRVYLAVGLIMFVSGTIGIVTMAVKLGAYPANSPAVANPAVLIAPGAAPVMISLSPSDMPSCAGLFSRETLTTLPQSGSDRFVMSDDGNTIVVANYNFNASMSFLETFQISSKNRIESTQAFSLSGMCLSSDGFTLVLGLNAYPHPESVEGVGGALVVLNLFEGALDWTTRHLLLIGGGIQSAVIHVSTSADGKTVAFVATSNATFYVEVYIEDVEENKLKRLGQLMNDTLFSANTIVEVSGDGSKFFVVTAENKVKGFEYTDNAWIQIGDAMEYNGVAPQVYPSFDGTLVVLSSEFNFPVSVFEINDSSDAVSWSKVADLDITESSQGQLASISADGRNVMVGELVDEQQTLARLFRRSGTIFSQVQDITLPGGILRGMRLNPDGELFVVAVNDDILTYQKDCSSSGNGIETSYPFP